ncbi:hypothetical protein V2W30_40890 (plasmid) [Streptomyces sp. Q6]|uniref:Uncharacterized protein n=1 Tax=Streptomyces citrinus TaxID=3118173 RepID=A0ACD5AR64_9ACTN
MTTARDLALLVLDGTYDRCAEPSELSLALAGARPSTCWSSVV